jgi:hypothetical protein
MLPLRPEGVIATSSPFSLLEDACVVLYPLDWFALFHLNNCIFISSDDAESVSETEQALRLYGVNHGSI